MEHFWEFLFTLFVVKNRICVAQVQCVDSTEMFIVGGADGGPMKIWSAHIQDDIPSDAFSEIFITDSQISALEFDQQTAILYSAEKGADSMDGDKIKGYPFNCDSQDPFTLATGTEHATDDSDITTMAIDGNRRMLYWNEFKHDSATSQYRNTIKAVPIGVVNGNPKDIYEIVPTNMIAVIQDIEVDITSNTLYWTLSHPELSVFFIESVDIGQIDNFESRELFGLANVQGVEIDYIKGKLYWSEITPARYYQIQTMDINSFPSGIIETHYSNSGRVWGFTNFFLSLAENKIYIVDISSDNILVEVPISGDTITSSTVIFETSNWPLTIHASLYIPTCPKHEISLPEYKYTAFEDEVLLIKVVRTGSVCLNPSVRVNIYEGTATRSDFAINVDGSTLSVDSYTVQFEHGQLSIELLLEIYFDNSPESNETFQIELKDPSPYESVGLGQVSQAEVVIVDRSSFFRFKQTNYEILEDNKHVNITVERSGYLSDSVQVNLVDIPGTADAGIDYELKVTSIFFNPFETEVVVVIFIYDDRNLEEAESFQLSFAEAPDRATVFIIDNEFGYSFHQAIYIINENADTVMIPVERIGSTELEGQVALSFKVVPGEDEDYIAIEGDDYTQFSDKELTFTFGQSHMDIYVYIIDDDQYENTESFQMCISDPQPAGSEIVNGTTTITILDNEENIRFAESAVTIKEGTISLFKMAIIRDVTFTETDILIETCQITKSAKEGEDYVPINSVVVKFPVGETTVYTPNILIVDDEEGEVAEAFKIVIISQSRSILKCGDENNAIFVSIIDDDIASYRFSKDNYNVPESSANVKIRIYLDGRVSATNQNTVKLQAKNGSAKISEDFLSIGSYNLYFGVLGYTDVLIQLVSDNDYEGDETFYLFLTNEVGNYTLTQSMVTIQDDDSQEMPLQPLTYYFRDRFVTVDEYDTLIKVIIMRSESSTLGTATVNTISESAEEDNDFFPVIDYPLYFSVGTVLIEQSIYIKDDKEAEDSEAFQLLLSSSDRGIAQSDVLTITITDNDKYESGNSISAMVTVGIIAGVAVILLIFSISITFIIINRNGYGYRGRRGNGPPNISKNRIFNPQIYY